MKFLLGITFVCVLILAAVLWYLWPPPSTMSLISASDNFLNRRAASLSHLLSLRPGMPNRMVARILGTRLYTECLLIGPGNARFRIYGVYVAPPTKTHMQHSGDWDYFWLIFRNGKYERTIEPVRPLIVEYPYEGTTADRLGDWPITDESRSGKALAARGLTAKQIEGEVTAPIPHGNPWNVLPAAIVVQLAVGHWRLAAANEQDARQIENTAKLAVRYEPSSIRLGMTPERVGILFQAPLRSWSLGGGRRAAIYGAANYLDESPLWNGTRFAVIFDHSKVVEVLGSAFYNDQWYEEPRRSKRHGASHRFPARNVKE